MASAFVTISASTAEIHNAGPPSSGRTSDGRMWCVVRDVTTTNLYRSDDNGLTWVLDSSASGLGGGQRILFLDPNGKIGVGNYLKTGTNQASYLLRLDGGGFSAVHSCATNTNQHDHGWYTRDSAGLGHAIFQRVSPRELRYYRQASATEDGAGWTGVDNELVASGAEITGSSKPSIICDRNDVPHVIYLDASLGRFVYRNRTGGVWSAKEDFAPVPTVHIGDFGGAILGGDRLTLYLTILAGSVSTTVYPYLATRNSAGVWSLEAISATYNTSSGHLNPCVVPGLDLNGTLYAYMTRDQDTAYFKRASGVWQVENFDFGGGTTNAQYCTGHGQHYPLVNSKPNYPSIGGWFAGRFNNAAGQTNQIAMLRGEGLTFSTSEDPPVCDPEPARTSFVFAGEGASAATLPVTPDFVWPERDQYLTHQIPTERGYVVTLSRMGSRRRAWRLGFRNHSKADRDALLAFIEDNITNAWTLPIPEQTIGAGGTTAKVYLRNPRTVAVKENPGVYTLEVEAEELLLT